MEAAARKAEAEKLRKEEEAKKEAELQAERDSAEQARLNSLGIKDQIKSYTDKLAAEGISKKDTFEFTKILEKLVKEQKIIDNEKKAQEAALLAAENLRKKQKAEEQALLAKLEKEAAAAAREAEK